MASNDLPPFQTSLWLKNAHIQTVLPRILRSRPVFQPFWQRLDTPDGDFLDLAWSGDPANARAAGKPLLIVFHGLEGSFNSPYANGLLQEFSKQGWLAVLMHFRGCSGTVNRSVKAYHSGETDDARYFLSSLHKRFPENRKAAVGFSLGGNMLSRYLAKYADEPLVDMAALVSAPFELAACAKRMEQGLSLLYNRYLVASLKRTAMTKAPLLRQHLSLSENTIAAITTLWQFDDLITAPLYGFHDAADYYQQCSGMTVLSEIKVETLIIQAADDPFMSDAVIPRYQLPANIDYRLYENGGHVGFISGSPVKPRFWLEKALPYYFRPLSR